MNRAIASLAILKVNWDQYKKDYLENFVPFIATLLMKKNYQEINVANICNDFKDEFGLIIPFHPMSSILNRAKKRNIIRKEQKKFFPRKENIEKYDFSRVSKDQLVKHEEIIAMFIDFAKNEYNVDLTNDDANSTFISCLRKHDSEILFAAGDSTILPDVKRSKSLEFLGYKFIKYIHEFKPIYFKFIENMAIGHMLSAPLLYDDFDKFKGKLSGLDIYLDTSFIIRLLGFEDEPRKAAYKDLIDMFKEQKCNLYIFRHTFDEIIGILHYTLSWIDDPKYDPSLASPVLRYFRKINYTQSDIDMILLKLDEKLGKLKIKIKEAPGPDELVRFQIDEEKLHQYIVDSYSKYLPLEAIEEKESAIIKDIKSISSILKYRKDKKPTSIKATKNIFVTTNASLAYANKKFENSQSEFRNTIPSCVTDTFIGTLIWLQAPTKFLAINERKIMADCYAASQPDSALLEKYMAELERLKNEGKIDEDEHYLLRTHRTAINLLQELTLGDHDNFADKTTEEILEEIKSGIRKESEQKYLEEKDSHDKDLLKLEEMTKKNEKTKKRAEQMANFISFTISGVLIFLFLLGTLSQLFTNFPNDKVLRTLLIIFSVCVGVLGAITGLNFKGLRDKIKNNIKNKIIKYLAG